MGNNVIKMGAVGSLRNYSVKQQGEGIAWRRGPANPFAAKVNSSGIYDRVDIWNEWVQEDWQAGVGRVDPIAGGYLYAEAETRVPKQIILPPLLQQCDLRTVSGVLADCRYMPSAATGTITVGSGGYARAAMSFTTPSTLPVALANYCFYARVPAGVSVTIATYTNSGGSPGTVITSTTVSGEHPDRNFYWYGSTLAHNTLTTSTQYWLVIYPTSGTDAIEVAYNTTGYNTVAKSYNGSAWSAISSTYLLYTTTLHRIPLSAPYEWGKGFFRFNGNLYAYSGEDLYKYDSANEQFDSVGLIPGVSDIESVAIFGPTVFFARHTAGNPYTTMDTSEAFTLTAVNAKLFLEYDGLLYRAYQNDLYYSSDGSTWSSAFQVGGDDVQIRGMAGMGDSLYLATDKALYRFAPGNVVEEVTRFGAEDSTNGEGMVEYQGRLYIPAGGRLFRFDPSGQMMDIWVSREDDLPSTRVGTVAKLARMNNWLVAYISPLNSNGRSSLWAWQEEGWHFLACSLQSGTSLSDIHKGLFYDRASSRLWFSGFASGPLFIDIEDYTLNPYNSATYLYQPYGWLEQDKFYGGQYLLNKAFDSVTIVGDNLSANVCVKVYWQDEGSTAWELLGTATSDGQELRWPIATRPLGKWVKLGLLLQTNDGDETPRVRAVIVKNLPFINDRLRDTVTLTLKDYIEMPDGSLDTYTMAQQLTHVQAMIETVGTFIYQDPLGVQYEVTAVDHSMGASRYGVGGTVKEMDITLVLEQVPDAAYT